MITKERLALLSKLRWLPIFLVLVLVFLPTPVLAVGDPDSITILSFRAYEGLWEEADMLFVVEYDVEYASEPDEDPKETFLMAIWDESAEPGPNIPLNYYQHHFISIYITPDQVTSLGYALNDELVVRIMGNPSYFSPLTEGDNMRTMTVTPGHWIKGSTIEITRTYLADWCLILAGVFEEAWGVTLLSEDGRINDTGRTKFREAIPGVDGICPEVFLTSEGFPGAPGDPGDLVFEATLQGRMGTRLETAMKNMSLWILGNESGYVLLAGLGLAVLYFILAGKIFLATGSVPGAIAISIPFLFVGNLVGVLPLTITFIAAFLVVVTFGVTFVLGRL